METKTEIETPAMDAMRYITHQYAGGGIARINGALIWEESGLARMGCIAGWLSAFALTQPELAETMAQQLIDRLKYLVNPDEKDKHPYGDFPVRRCVLADDGSLHGFSLCWYYLVPVAVGEAHGEKTRWWSPFQTDVLSKRGFHTMPYLYDHNGGLLWHGPGDNSFACSLNACYWGVHT